MRSAAVVRRLEEILEAALSREVPWPHIPEPLLQYLEALFPPRCLGTSETTENHLRYAGAAELVKDLRYHFDVQQGPDGDELQLDVELGPLATAAARMNKDR